MPPRPELVIGDILIADTDIALGVFQHDACQLFHFESLRVDRSYCFDVGDDMVKVNRFEGNDVRLGRHGAFSLWNSGLGDGARESKDGIKS